MAGLDVAFTFSNWDIFKQPEKVVPKLRNLAIGGAVANGTPESLIAWAAFFCEFSQWIPTGRRRYMKDCAGANISYKREVFDKVGVFIEGTYCSDTNFHWRLEEVGHRLLFAPSILV